MPDFAGGLSIWHETQKCVHIVEWVEPYTGEEMEQLRESSRQKKGWSPWSSMMHSNQSRWLCSNKNVMLTWWRRRQDVSLASGIWHHYYKECMYNQGDMRPPVKYHCLQGHMSSTCSHMQYHLCSSSRKPLCILGQQTSSCNQVQGHQATDPCDFDLHGQNPGIWSQHLVVIKMYVIFVPKIFWRFKTLFRSDVWHFFWFTENWLT